jgi:hypothetical protein
MNLSARMTPDMEIDVRLINGQPGVVYRRRGRAFIATAVEVVDGVVVGIYSVVTPTSSPRWTDPHPSWRAQERIALRSAPRSGGQLTGGPV